MIKWIPRLIVFISLVAMASGIDQEIISNLEFFENYEYVEYQEENQTDELAELESELTTQAEGFSAIKEKDIRDITAIGTEEVNSDGPQESR